MGKTKLEPLRDVVQTRRPNRWRLLAPLRYLAISAYDKRKYDLVFPLCGGVGLWLGYNCLSPQPALLGANSILASVQTFLVLAVPFLIGALASVAMGSPGDRIDKRVYGTGVVLDGRTLSLRQFVCYLLGYLSFLGLTAFVLITIASFVAPSLIRMLTEATYLSIIFKQIFAATMFILFSAFTTTVFWALYFLTDVVNRTD